VHAASIGGSTVKTHQQLEEQPMRVNRASTGGGSSDQGDGSEGADDLRNRTDRGNQNDEGIGSSATRGGGGGEANAPRRGGAADLDPTPDTADRFGPGGGSSGNPDVTGTTDVTED
jgi:hypothetical protein